MRFYARPLAYLSLALLPLAAQAQLRVATYNISNYSGGNNAALQTAIMGEFNGRSMKPDALLLQEMVSAAAVANIVSALNTAPGSPADYAAATFVNGPDTDSAFVYRTSKLTLLATVTVAVGGGAPNHPRNIMRYDVRLAGYQSEGASLSLYSSHMKAGTTQSDAERRLLEAQRIRANAESLPRPFLLGGDFNVQTSSDASYVELTGTKANNQGRFFDPIRTPGNWNNSSAFRFVHTQDPIGTGGMDDRFDFVLLSSLLVDGDGFDYIGNPNVAYSTSTWNDPNHSYRAWGNDGSSFDTTLAVGSNTMVGPDIAQAIIDLASGAGHLPVFLDLRVPPEMESLTVIDFGTVRQNAAQGRFCPVLNAGDVAKWGQNGIADLRYTLATTGPFGAPGGQFTAAPGQIRRHLVTLDTTTTGIKTGTLTIASNAPDEPVRVIQLRANVVQFSNGGGDTGG